MAKIQNRVILYSNELYIVFDKKRGIGMAASNRSVLSRHTGIKYNRLRYIFGLNNKGVEKTFYEDEDYVIMKIYTNMIFKRKDKGGMRGLKNNF